MGANRGKVGRHWGARGVDNSITNYELVITNIESFV